MIFFFAPDDPRPVGGIKTIYRHVDILNRSGVPAAVVHKKRGFRCNWFDHETRIEYQRRIQPNANDLVVIPEVYGPRSADIYPEIRKVVFNQNAYYTFVDHPTTAEQGPTPCQNPQVVAVVVVSDDSRDYLRYVFPDLPVHRVHLSVSSSRFRYRALASKLPQIAYMPRKHPEDARQVINLLKFRGMLNGFQLVPIDGKTESETARILEESLFFFSFGYPEGWPAPPAEAMMCGCLVIGYDGFGGREYFRPEFGYPVPAGDILAFARTAERAMGQLRSNPEESQEMTRRASNFIREEYPEARETREVVEIYRKILS